MGLRSPYCLKTKHWEAPNIFVRNFPLFESPTPLTSLDFPSSSNHFQQKFSPSISNTAANFPSFWNGIRFSRSPTHQTNRQQLSRLNPLLNAPIPQHGYQLFFTFHPRLKFPANPTTFFPQPKSELERTFEETSSKRCLQSCKIDGKWNVFSNYFAEKNTYKCTIKVLCRPEVERMEHRLCLSVPPPFQRHSIGVVWKFAVGRFCNGMPTNWWKIKQNSLAVKLRNFWDCLAPFSMIIWLP